MSGRVESSQLNLESVSRPLAINISLLVDVLSISHIEKLVAGI